MHVVLGEETDVSEFQGKFTSPGNSALTTCSFFLLPLPTLPTDSDESLPLEMVAGKVQYSQPGMGPERAPVTPGNFQYVCEMIALKKRKG